MDEKEMRSSHLQARIYIYSKPTMHCNSKVPWTVPSPEDYDYVRSVSRGCLAGQWPGYPATVAECPQRLSGRSSNCRYSDIHLSLLSSRRTNQIVAFPPYFSEYSTLHCSPIYTRDFPTANPQTPRIGQSHDILSADIATFPPADSFRPRMNSLRRKSTKSRNSGCAATRTASLPDPPLGTSLVRMGNAIL